MHTVRKEFCACIQPAKVLQALRQAHSSGTEKQQQKEEQGDR